MRQIFLARVQSWRKMPVIEVRLGQRVLKEIPLAVPKGH
jgi:hypothetical protein